MLCPRKYLSANAWRVHLAHDLQPYQCTYKNCDDERRIYGTREEWLEHEAQHSLAWHCRLHAVSEEFETRAEYKLHLRNEHPDAPPELSSEELIANAVAQSEHPRRDCPLCPTPLSTSFERQKHMIYHLERFALFALPLLEDDEESQQSDHPSRSNRGQNIGREQSIACDFSQGAISFSTDANDTSAAIDNTIIEEASLVSEPRFQGHDFQNYHVDPQGKPDGTTSRKSPAPIMRIAVAGGGGFAELLVQELSRTANSVMVLSRAPHAEFEANYDCQVVVVDYRNIDSLQYTLQGVDLVISTFSGAEQLNLIDAARRARVRTFVPSEFGGPLTMTPAPKFGPFDKGSSAALERLRHWASSRHNPMKYTVFSCGMFYEHFGPGGLEAYNIMGTTCRHCLGGTFIDIQLGKAELPDGNSQGHPVLINLTSAVDVARFVAAAVELGIDSWPLEFTMRGACITPQRIQTLCSEVRQVQFEVISRPYAEIIAWIDYYENHSDEERWLAMQQLLQIADGRYTFESANLNELVDFEPMGFRQWLYDNWGPREDRDTDEKAIKAERQLETPEKLDLRIHLGEATAH
ncbi:hypothetical protein F5Y10DRAFT_233571 [Nemania abortiva]|nr:hypothetical protein F5Y10DRAFT_233571 [Nemania abortiva]